MLTRSNVVAVSWALAALTGASLTTGCQQSQGVSEVAVAGEMGSIQLPLVAQSASGVTYRLRDAAFELDGPTYVTIDTRDESPEDTSLELDLPVGSYDAHLVDGWRLVRVESDGSETGVEAHLTSGNPLSFSISAGQISPVVFRFRIGSGDVDFGGAEIGIEVDDGASCVPVAETCNNLDDDCDSVIDEAAGDTYYRDSDRDGFGDAAMSVSACALPSGYVANSTDCSDLSSNMRPGQTNYYTIGIGQSFDYNCDGVETPRDTKTQACAGITCTAGWVGAAPGCGQIGTFGLCNGFFGSCGGTQSRTQACR